MRRLAIIVTGLITIFAIIFLVGQIRNFHKRIFGCVELSSRPESFWASKIYNKNPNAEGILSTCLYGDDGKKGFRERYIVPVIRSKKHALELLPRWQYRIYMAPNISPGIISEFLKENFEVYIMNRVPKGNEGMMWRFYPAAENIPFLSVDSDDDIAERNKLEAFYPEHVKKWLFTDKPFFQKRLSWINLFVPISGGCWGGKGFCVPDIKQRIEKYNNEWFGADEAFLTKEIWPLFKEKGYYKTPTGIREIAFVLGIIISGLMIIILVVNIVLKMKYRGKNSK
jgi:hypothetical protein